MAKAKFKIGDRVRAVADYDDNPNIVGKIGTVRHIDRDGDLGVEFDADVDGHKLFNRSAKKGFGWYMPASLLVKITKPVKKAAKKAAKKTAKKSKRSKKGAHKVRRSTTA